MIADSRIIQKKNPEFPLLTAHVCNSVCGSNSDRNIYAALIRFNIGKGVGLKDLSSVIHSPLPSGAMSLLFRRATHCE